MLLIYETKTTSASARASSRAPSSARGAVYYRALVDSGVYVGGALLEPPSTGATVRVHGGQRRVQDGPYADTKEQLGGQIVLELASLDEALDWAARCPSAASGAVEVRPVSADGPRAGRERKWLDDPRRVVELVARESYGPFGGATFLRARATSPRPKTHWRRIPDGAPHLWPRDGVPGRPEAWLCRTTARRRLHRPGAPRTRQSDAEPTIRLLLDGLSRGAESIDDLTFPTTG